jgi:hypothetical protein
MKPVKTQEEMKATVRTGNRFILDSIVSTFDPIRLDEMEEHNLQERVDTKFMINTAFLPDILEEVKSGIRS